MKIVVPQLQVTESDGFKNDILGRGKFGESLTNLIVNSSDKLVISLDGKWGEGKTTFVKMWMGMLKEKGIPHIYIDAFENDYSNDAFITIASAITSYAEKHCPNTTKKQELITNAKKVGTSILSFVAKATIKAATLGAIGAAEIKSLKDDMEEIAEIASEAAGNIIEARLKEHSDEIGIFAAFRKTLSELPSALKHESSSTGDSVEKSNLVIIIDELDRCKPNFSVEIIEKIKHFFSVDNIFFLLVVNKEQMEGAIKSVYGASIDAHTYLQKFINVETSIPRRIDINYTNDIDVYCRGLFDTHGISHDLMLQFTCTLARHFQFSLRQIEKALTNISIICITSKNMAKLVPAIVVFISTLKVSNPILYKKLSSRSISFEKISKEVGAEELESTSKGKSIIATLKAFLLSNEEFGKLSQSDPSRFAIESYQFFDREDVIKNHCQKLDTFSVD